MDVGIPFHQSEVCYLISLTVVVDADCGQIILRKKVMFFKRGLFLFLLRDDMLPLTTMGPGVSVTSRLICLMGSHPASLTAGVTNRSQMSVSLSSFLLISLKIEPQACGAKAVIRNNSFPVKKRYKQTLVV